MSLIDEYKKERRRLINLNYRLRKKGFNAVGLPPIPKRITKGSIQKLVKTIAKLQRDRDIAKKRQVKNSYKKTKQSTKAQSKKTNKKSKTSNAKTNTKKKPSKGKSPNANNYLPYETQSVLDNVANTLFGVDTIEELLDNMNAVIGNERYTMIHRERVSDLKNVLSRQYTQYLTSENNNNIADNLQANAESVNKGIEDITGYVFDSSEKDYQLAVEAVVELSYYLSGHKMDSFDLTRIENLYDEYKNELGGEYYDDMPFFETMMDDLPDINDEFDVNIVI